MLKSAKNILPLFVMDASLDKKNSYTAPMGNKKWKVIPENKL